MDIFDDDESKLKYIGHRRGIATCHRLNRRRRKIPHWKNEEMNKKQKFGLINTVDVEDDDNEIIDEKINERSKTGNKVDGNVEDDDNEIIDGKINERSRTDNRVDGNVEDHDNEIIDGKINERSKTGNKVDGNVEDDDNEIIDGKINERSRTGNRVDAGNVEDDDNEIIDGKINEKSKTGNKVDGNVEDDDNEIIDGKINERSRTGNRVDGNVEDHDNEIIDGKINERPRTDNRNFLNHAAANCAFVASMPLCDEPITTDIIIEVNGNITDEEFLNSDKLIPFDFFRFCPVGKTEFKREVRPGWVFHSHPSTTEEILAEIKRWEAEDEANLEEMDKELKLGLNNTVDDVGKVEDNDIEIIDQKINERSRTDNRSFSKYAAVNHASVASMPLCDEPIASQPVFIRSMLSSQTINQILSPIPRFRSFPPIHDYDYVSNIQRSQVVDERARTMMSQRNIQTTIMEPNYWNRAVGPYARNISSAQFQLRPRNPRIPNNNHRS